jgi:hypothetical protein
VVYLTLSIDGEVGDARRTALDDAVSRQGGTLIWRTSEAVRRWYALLELPERHDRTALAELSGGVLYDRAIIALALFPAVPEALPHVREALAGPGRPAGILASYPCEGGAVVEWDPEATAPAVVLDLVDVELGRFQSGRTAELLAPLPPAVAAAVASRGLQTPQLETGRILEMRVEGA